ncbi:MAG: enoyl-CoA hydratase-related protein [Flavobacteriales bacterium]
MSSILLKKENGIGFIHLNRPNVYNSFNREMALAMHAALDNCASDVTVRCVVIEGIGKAFCAGQDLSEVVDPKGPALENIVAEHYNPMILKITSLEKPVVCAVNGIAAGAGANIALSCDVIIAKESAAFLQAFSKIGLIPDSGGTWILPRTIGYQKALAITMLGDKISAPEAEQMGMIYKSVEDFEYESYVLKIASKLAGMPTKGLAYTKKAYQLSMNQNLEQQLQTEGEYQFKASKTSDYAEGVQAFLEKRKPEFKGQ